MRLSKSFLNNYIDVKDIDYNDLAKKMVQAGNEYESITKISSATGLVVGHVLECVKHPESTKLSVCKVDLGSSTKQIICGAANIAADQKVVVATIGAKLPNGVEIKAAKLAGMDSEGMICSLLELGIEPKYLSEEDKDGIHVLAKDAPIGTDAILYLGFNDEVIDFELTSNRADLLSVLGMAYEVGAIYNKKVTLPEFKVNEIAPDINTLYKIDLQTENCPIYLGKLVRNVIIQESPYFIKTRLIASGIRPINNVVDISNYVMLEFGQPLHFFDSAKLGNKVVVRMAKDNETMTTLDGAKRVLNINDIVIASDTEIVALAGVMGGLNTEVTKDTKDIFIESAIFNPLNIRTTSKNILRSEASNRFEKGVDPNRTLMALNRACYLLNKYASGEVLSGVLTHDKVIKEPKHIKITLAKINNVLGMNLIQEEVVGIFNRLGFTVVSGPELDVLVPTRRTDISIKEDLIEEVGRIYSYDNVLGLMPKTNIKSGTYSNRATIVKELRNELSALGLNQVITYSLVSASDINKFVPVKHNEVMVLNPMNEDRKYMRQSLLNGLLGVWEYNNARNIKDVNIFEIGASYYKDTEYKEDMMLAGLLSDNYIVNEWQGKTIKADFYLVKGVVETIIRYLGLNNRYSFTTDNIPTDYHPNRSASIMIDKEIVGYVGQIHPTMSKKEIYVFEINLDKLLTFKVREIKFKELSKYPAINKDLAFVVDRKVTALEIMNIITKVGGRLLTNLDVFDLYVGENVLSNEKSIAYSLTFEDPTKTLSDEEVNNIITKIVSEVETTISAKLRTK